MNWCVFIKKIYRYLKRYKQFFVTSANCRIRVQKRLPFWRILPDIGTAHACLNLPKNNVCLQEQCKQSFLTLPKENQSPLGFYRNPTFLFTNSRFMLLICNWCFVLLATNHRCVRGVLHHPPEWIPPMTVSRSERKMFILFLNMYIVPTKIHWFATGGFCSPPGAVWDTF